jgi:two-component system, cell cycle sensor histidine kinase and response regulator CckA
MTKKPDKSTKVTGLSKQTEELLRMTKGDVAAMPVKDVQRLVHELQVQQIELAAQNEELRRTQVELEAAGDRYMDLYDFSPAGQLKLDTSSTIAEANLRAATLLGTNRKELIGQPLARIIAVEDQDIFHRHCRKVLKTGTRQTCELQIQEATGAKRWVYLQSLTAHEKPGQTTHWRTVLLDITERKRSEQAFRLAKFSVERAADAVYWIDPQAKVLDVNEAASLMLGYSKDELCAMTLYDLDPDFQADMWPGFWAETKRRGTKVFETAHRAKNGRLIPIEVSVNYLLYEGKEYHCAFVRDITERKRAREELRRSRAFITSVVENLPNMIFVKDAKNLKYIRFNKAGEDLLGYSREDLIGKSDYDFFPKAEADFFTETDRQVLKAGRLHDIPEESIQTRDKGQRILHTKKIPLLDADGTPQYLLGISEDITERKRLEAQFRQVQKMEAVGRLAGGMAHDFNNLLTVINGYSALIIDQLSLEDPRLEMAVKTLRAGELAGELTKQLLAFSRKQILMPQPLNFNDSLRSISSILNPLLNENVTLTMDLAPDLWSINGDKGQLDQVTMNLAINACDAMPDGGDLTIATRNLSVGPQRTDHHRMMPPGDYVHVSVCDTGHGMSDETLSHLFEPFFTTKEVGQGTGLGLATAYGIVRQSQGYIFPVSALGRGTTFHLYYPRVVTAPAVAKTPPVRSRKGSESLLIVEDHESVRALVVQALKWCGYRVIEAANGEDALRIAASLPEPVHALVTDVRMPHMSGPEVAERLRGTWPGLRVLFMSGYTDLIKPAFLDEPGTAFIQKPFSPDTLARHLRDLLERSI